MKKLFYIATVIMIAVSALNSCQNNATKEPATYDITVIGKVVTVNDNLISIKVLTGLHFDDAILIIKENTEYSQDTSQQFLENNIIIVEIESEIEATRPVRLTAKKILSNKPLK